MPNDNTQPTAPVDNSAPMPSSAASFASNPTSSAIVLPTTVDQSPVIAQPNNPAEVAHKIGESHNVLIALSSDPSVDELTAAIGLSIFLDRNGKHATAIYSGTTPNAIEFLNPGQTFEPTVDALQDFVIALDKEKADHLRYKVDGEYVKIFITPYLSKISEDDLDFSYGDYNVDLVIALDVVNGIDLDSALREHGRIMHDATVINITTGNPGKFGEIEWSDKHSSSVSEMIAKLLYSMNAKEKLGKEEATAFLTGIVAATNRFSNAATTPDTMRLASRLMESGANQQLIAKNITPDTDNELYSMDRPAASDKDTDLTNLDVSHNEDLQADNNLSEVNGEITAKESTLLDDLKAAEASLAAAGAEVTSDDSGQPIRFSSSPDSTDIEPVVPPSIEPVVEEPIAPPITAEPIVTPDIAPITPLNTDQEPAIPTTDQTISPIIAEPTTNSITPQDTIPSIAEPAIDFNMPQPPEAPALQPTPSAEIPNDNPESSALPPVIIPEVAEAPKIEPSPVEVKTEKVIAPPSASEMSAFDSDEDYGKMLEDALASDPNVNPATISAPQVSTITEANNIPEIDYMPMPGEGVFPPPITPPIDMSDSLSGDVSQPVAAPPVAMSPVATSPAAPEPFMPQVAAVTPSAPASPVAPAAALPQMEPQPSPQASSTPASDPSAFKIPGM